jgi:hypothetical protein
MNSIVLELVNQFSERLLEEGRLNVGADLEEVY